MFYHAKLIDANLIKLNDKILAILSTQCNYNQTESCFENYHFARFNTELELNLKNAILKTHWNATDPNFYYNYFVQEPQINEIYSTELNSKCSDFMSSLFILNDK